MKEDIKSLEIRPEVDYIDFIGPAKSENVKGTDSVLKGQIHFTITKPTKIRSMYVKFKGFSRISLEHPTNMEITTQLLPKLKLPLFGKTNLPVGDHVIPWEIEVPNIYPRTLITKRANINYKVIVCINTSIARSVSAECIIFLRRHLLPYKEIAPIIETKIFEQTIPNKFHYEIDAPQIVCLEQKHVPISIKYLSFANQKQVQGIRTRLIQIELYRYVYLIMLTYETVVNIYFLFIIFFFFFFFDKNEDGKHLLNQ
jgi:hypothetical protein